LSDHDFVFALLGGATGDDSYLVVHQKGDRCDTSHHGFHGGLHVGLLGKHHRHVRFRRNIRNAQTRFNPGDTCGNHARRCGCDFAALDTLFASHAQQHDILLRAAADQTRFYSAHERRGGNDQHYYQNAAKNSQAQS